MVPVFAIGFQYRIALKLRLQSDRETLTVMLAKASSQCLQLSRYIA